MHIPVAVILIGLLVFLAHALDDLFARTRVPDVLLLLGLGLLLGPVSGLVRPEHFGAVGPVFTTLTLVVILFEGGLGLELRTLGRALGGATALTVWNFLLSLAVLAPLARLCLGFGWMQAFTLAAILGGTSSAVVIPLVQRLALGERTRTALALESALSDVLVIVVALGLMAAQAQGELHLRALLGGMGASFLVSALLGAAAGLAWALLLERMRGLQKSLLTTPAYVLVAYGLVELLGFSGAITALALGVTLGNAEALPLGPLRPRALALAGPTETERALFAELSFLLKSFFFVYVGLSIRLGGAALVWTGLALTTAVFLLRIPVVHASLRPASVPRPDALAAGAMTAKGLAAAAVASVPLQMGLPGGRELQLTVFAVVLFSILATSLLVFLEGRGWLAWAGRLLYGRYREDPPA